MNKLLLLLVTLMLSPLVFASEKDPRIEKIVAQGVPRASLLRILRFIKENTGRDLNMDVYSCHGWSPKSEAACHASRRANLTRAVHIKAERYAAVIDFSLPSTERRLFIIDLKEGAVEKYFVAHGRGSGIGRYATKFSNRDRSHQSSLGLYITGGTYAGHYGAAMRLYGLEKSNSKAYDRDIVMHSAWYASDRFIHLRDKKTGVVRNRLGLSYGCPAVAPNVIRKVIAKLKGGTIIDIYHPSLMPRAASGADVVGPEIVDETPTAPLTDDEDASSSEQLYATP
jgi:hypothetical protein